MSSVETEEDTTHEPRWNNVATLVFVVPYAIAYAFAFRIHTLSKYDGLRWNDIQAKLFGEGIEADMLWITVAAPLVFCGIVAAVATAWDALRARPLQPVGAFSYGIFLFVTVMLTCLSIMIVLDWVKANESALSLSVRGAVPLAGLFMLLALLHLVTRKPISPVTASYLGAAVVVSTSLTFATMLFGI
jgi:hypothetical protein